jgi:hypothetical protein
VIVLDTNVVSAMMTGLEDPARRWLSEQERAVLRTTSITVAEVEFGIARLPEGRRRRDLAEQAGRVWETFPDFALPFDTRAAYAFGELRALRERAGRPIQRFDAQIAAICLVRGATLATRNVKDFEGTGVEVVDPWAA